MGVDGMHTKWSAYKSVSDMVKLYWDGFHYSIYKACGTYHTMHSFPWGQKLKPVKPNIYLLRCPKLLYDQNYS